jgi:hypothetical protein
MRNKRFATQKTMCHFKTEDWINFVRGTVEPVQGTDMQKHLDEQCQVCAPEFDVWKWMREFGSREAQNSPSLSAVDSVKTAFKAVSPEKRNIMREIAEMIFDSNSQPQFAGVRGVGQTARQLLFRAGGVLIDMQMEAPAENDRMAIMGQVLSGETKQALRQIGVHLLRGTNELASTATNQFGEFYLEHPSSTDLQVSLDVSQERQVFIPLDESIWRVSASQPSKTFI